MVYRDIGVWETVDPPAHTDELAFFAKLSEVLVMKPPGTHLSSTHDP
jgi:hypothetical protein